MRTGRLSLIVSALAGLIGLSAEAQLLHRYDFETAGSANDTVGTAHGIINGSATVSGGALNTTGAAGGLSGGVPQNCASLPASAVAGITNAFSLEVWYVANYNGGYCTLFSFSANNPANYLLATPARGTSPFQSDVAVKGGGGGSGEQLASQIYCDNATLHDMVVTYDGTNVTYYLDGTLPTYSGLQNAFADAGLVLSNLTYIGVGGGSPYAVNTINGRIYDFRIYGQALTLNQVAAIYELGTNASNASISNALAASPPSGVTFNGSLVRMPFYGAVGLHDPGTMVKEGNRYFIYGDGTGIPGNVSTDLRNWTLTSAVFPGGPPAWTTNSVPGGSPDDFWAPDTAYFNGLWHMYYAYSQWGSINSVIGLATSPSLTNAVWTDQGKVVKSYSPATGDTDTTLYNCIDPSIYVAANGTVWMSYGSYSSGILIAQLDPATGLRLNTNSIGAQVANNAAGGGWGSTEEASYIYQHGGYWYLFVNWGGCCNLTYSTYNIRVGRSSSPTGPYYDQNGVDLNQGGGTMFLESTARYIGPGHPAILNDNGTNWFTYHFYDGLANGYPTVGMNQFYWSADGWPVLTNEWSALYPLAADANESSGNYNGTLQNNAGFTNDPARGWVLYLDGVTNYVSLPLSVGNASTFAAWVNWKGGADWQRIFDFGNDTANYFFLTPRANTGVMRFAINAGGGEQQINAPFALPANSWHHVAVTLDGLRGILYLDGAPIATNNSLTIRPWQTVPHNNNLGKSQFASDPFYVGEISSFRIFGRALSAAEMRDIYSAHPALSHRYSFSTNGRVAGWDSIGLAHGTLLGNAVVTNNALKLTGASGGYANLPSSLVSGCAAVTLECWATLGANGNWARVFESGGMSGGNGYNSLFFTPHNGDGQQQMTLSTGGGTATLATGGTLDNKTVHLAAIWDPAGNYIAIYTNGVLEAQQTNPVPSPTGVAGVFDANAWSFIGRSLWSSDAYLNGAIDELRLYDGRLTPAQIAADYVAGPNVIGLFDVWIGLGTNQNWGTSSNWISAQSPNPMGDAVFFAGTTGLAPNLDANYSVNGLTFATNAGSFTIGTTNGSVLTLAGAGTLANNSTATQTLNVPIRLSGTQTINAAPGNIILANAASGSGGVSKIGSGTLTLAGANLYTGGTLISSGTLLVNGSLGSGDVAVVSSGRLGGNGTIGGFMTVQAGGTLSPGSGIGKLTVNNSVALQAGSTTILEISKTPMTNDQLIVSGALTYGGMLVVSNFAGTFAGGESFRLFSAGSINGSFNSTSLPMLNPSLAWNLSNLSNGVLTVVQTLPTNLLWSVSGASLNLSWPAGHTGWRLQVQTNALSGGLGTNWVDVADSTTTNMMTLPVDAAKGSVFYRLAYP